jgi:hypothetical protein
MEHESRARKKRESFKSWKARGKELDKLYKEEYYKKENKKLSQRQELEQKGFDPNIAIGVERIVSPELTRPFIRKLSHKAGQVSARLLRNARKVYSEN